MPETLGEFRKMPPDQPELVGITELLTRIQNRDPNAMEELILRVHDAMRRIAHGLMEGERDEHTLHTTALVNEAVLKLMQTPILDGVTDRIHLFTIVGRVMRHVLIDYARSKAAEKRGGDRSRVPLAEAAELLAKKSELSASDLAEALAALEERHARASAVVHLRYFGGHTVPEIATILNVSVSTVESDWRYARAWLFARLNN